MIGPIMVKRRAPINILVEKMGVLFFLVEKMGVLFFLLFLLRVYCLGGIEDKVDDVLNTGLLGNI